MLLVVCGKTETAPDELAVCGKSAATSCDAVSFPAVTLLDGRGKQTTTSDELLDGCGRQTTASVKLVVPASADTELPDRFLQVRRWTCSPRSPLHSRLHIGHVLTPVSGFTIPCEAPERAVQVGFEVVCK